MFLRPHHLCLSGTMTSGFACQDSGRATSYSTDLSSYSRCLMQSDVFLTRGFVKVIDASIDGGGEKSPRNSRKSPVHCFALVNYMFLYGLGIGVDLPLASARVPMSSPGRCSTSLSPVVRACGVWKHVCTTFGVSLAPLGALRAPDARLSGNRSGCWAG